jgi:23S rRNA (uracil1939-C5)-methyltransferase
VKPADLRSVPPLVPGARHRVEITERDDHGRGRAVVAGRDLRVPSALPHEILEVRLNHVGRRFATGRIEHVLRAAPERVQDVCPHGAVCPGCGLRTTDARRRREFKRERLVAALGAAGFGSVPVAETVPAPTEDGWRHKAYLTARRTRRGLFLGLYEESSHRLLGIEGCLAHAPGVERALLGARQALGRLDPPTYDERSRQGWLRYVAVRASAATGEALVTLVARDRAYEGDRALAEEIRARAPHVAGVVLNVHGAPGNAPFGSEFLPLDGAGEIEERSGDLRLRVSAGSFFQVNPAAGARLHDDVRRIAALAPPGPALDLYGGVGATALRLAADGRRVTLVEAPGPAAEDALHNARGFASGVVRVRPGRVETEISRAVDDPPAFVVANPPRSGLPPEVVEGIARSGAPLLAYVSCDPRTLARDSAALAGRGYRLESVTPYDLMPQTPHVEALATLRHST